MSAEGQKARNWTAGSRRVPALAMVAGLLVLGATIALTARQLRESTRLQTVQRDGALLHAVALARLEEVAEEFPGEDPDLLSVLLMTSRMKGVLAARLMDGNGRFREAFPVSVRPGDLGAADVAMLKSRRPVCRFHDALSPDSVFYPEPIGAGVGLRGMEVLEVVVPLHREASGPILGAAQFLIEGHSVASEFRRLDRQLIGQALGVLVVAGSLLVGAMAWAFRRMRRVQVALEERSRELRRANQDLALTARMGAVGTVATHLFHGLKSPLAGLQQFMATAGRDAGEWEQAAEVTRRMQAMIHDVVDLVREEESGVRYELGLAELTHLVLGRVQAKAVSRGVLLHVRHAKTSTLDNREANLVALILINLLENAVEASGPGQSVELEVEGGGQDVVFRVVDHGTGLPSAMVQEPFIPRRSTKEGGSGIGLAICRHLAMHMGAELTLRQSGEAGSVFELRLPGQRGAGLGTFNSERPV